jgi:hypothetical protein
MKTVWAAEILRRNEWLESLYERGETVLRVHEKSDILVLMPRALTQPISGLSCAYGGACAG